MMDEKGGEIVTDRETNEQSSVRKKNLKGKATSQFYHNHEESFDAVG